MTDTVDKVIIQSSSEGTDQATAELQGLATAYDGVTVASQSTEKSTTSVESKFAALERRSGTTTGKLTEFAKIQQTVNLAVAQNPALLDRGNAVLAAAEQRYGGVSQALQKQRDEMEKLASVQRTVNQTTGVTGLGDSTARAADVETYGKQLDNLRAKYNPLFAAGQQYKATLTDINQAVKVGALTEVEAAAAITRTKSAFADQVTGLRGVKGATDEATKSTGLARYELINLSRQAQDVAVSLGSGQSFGTVLLQQGTQVADVFASSEGTVKGFFGQVVSGAASILTPMRLAVAGVAGFGAAAVYLGYQWSEAQTKVDQSLIGIGARTGSTAADINSFAKANSSATGLSIAESRNLGEELTKTGNIAVGSLKGAGDAVKGYAILTGKDATEATKDFATALSGDLVEGLKKLDAPYGSLNAKTLDYLRSLDLQAAGSLDASAKTQALQTWIDGVAASNKKAEGTVGGLTKAYQLLGNVFSAIKNGPAPGSGPVATPDQLKQQQTTAVNALGPSADLTNLGGPEGLAGVAQMGAQLDELNKKLRDIDAGPAKAQLDALSAASDGLVHSIVPQIDQIHRLEAALATLKLAQAHGVAAQGSDAATTAIQNQIAGLKDAQGQAERYNQRVAAISTQWGDVGQSTALALQSAQNQLPVLEAVGGAARMAAQATADYKNYLDQGKTSAEALALSASNYAASQAQVNSAARETLASLQDQAAVAGASNPLEAAHAQAQATFNSLIRQGVDEQLAMNVAAQQESNARDQIYQKMEKAVQASRDAVALEATKGTEEQASVKASIAYRNAIDAGATSSQAAAIAANTGAVAQMQWADQAQKTADAMERAARAAQDALYADPGGSFGYFQYKSGIEGNTASTDPRSIFNNTPGATQTGSNWWGTADPSSQIQALITAAMATGNPDTALASLKRVHSTDSALTGAISSLYDLKVTQAGDDNTAKSSIYNDELTWMQSQPQTIQTMQKIADLKNSIEKLKTSTDGLNATNQDLLSPYYSQDPRTSHIGFRSQGMATGGELTVPGGYSANDNMFAQIPVASGEIVSVRRPGQNLGGGNTQQINMGGIHITVQGGGGKVDANAIGRTVYQVTQTAAKQLAMAGR